MMTDLQALQLSTLIDEEMDSEMIQALREDPELAAMAETVRQIRGARSFEPASPGFAEAGWQRIRQETAAGARVERRSRSAWARRGWLTAAASLLVVAAAFSTTWWNQPHVGASELQVKGIGEVADLGVEYALFPRYVGGTDTISYGVGDSVILWNRTEQKAVPLPLKFAYARDAAWSPDGKLVAFSGYPDAKSGPATPGIWVAERDGSNPRQIAKPADPDTSYESPAWSPDGKRIAFTAVNATLSDAAGVVYERKVMLANSDGGNVTPLAEGRNPAWSPDGTRLAYTAESEAGQPEIWVSGVDGADARKLADGDTPSWSPNSPFIAYMKLRSEHRTLRMDAEGKETFGADAAYRELWAVNVESGKETPLTAGEFPQALVERMMAESDAKGEKSANYAVSGVLSDEYPAWSPDGKGILFTRSANEEKGPHFTLQELQISYR